MSMTVPPTSAQDTPPHGGRRPHPTRRSLGVFSSTIRLGRVAGIDIGINWTWTFAFVLFAWTLARYEFPAASPGRSTAVYAVMGAAAAAGLFASLILHELGHALRARREGVAIDGITLWLFGGVAKLGSRMPSAGAEFRIAIAGPLVSLTLAVVLGAIALAVPAGVVRSAVAWLSVVNGIIVAFNLVPAMPLDGGRVLRALLWARGHDLSQATRRATRIGAALAALMMVLGFVEVLAGGIGGLWLAAIGWFVLEAGRVEELDIEVRDALRGVRAVDVMTSDPVHVDAADTLEAIALRMAGRLHTAYPVVEAGVVVGLLHFAAAVVQLPPGVRAADAMTPVDELPLFGVDAPAVQVLDRLAEGDIGRGLVVQDGHVVGIVALSDLARVISREIRAIALARDAGHRG